MIPNISTNLGVTLAPAIAPSRTFSLAGDMIDGLDAVRQAISLILSTERFDYLIYSWNYGAELRGLIGRPTEYVLPELKRRISEALLEDDRIQSVDSFTFSVQRDRIECTFIAVTDFGQVEVTKEVDAFV